jgi:hypothetical protein
MINFKLKFILLVVKRFHASAAPAAAAAARHKPELQH